MVKSLAANAGDVTDVQSLVQEDPPGEGNGSPLQCSCLENSMGRGAWWATVHGTRKSQTGLHTGETRIKFKIEYVAQRKVLQSRKQREVGEYEVSPDSVWV